MTTQDQAIESLMRLPAAALKELGSAFQEGVLRHGFSAQLLFPFAGKDSEVVTASLSLLCNLGCTTTTLGLICSAVGAALSKRDDAERCIQLVLSGPEVTGIPVVDTKTTVMSLFEEAREEVLITSYVFFEAAEFFQALAEKHDKNQNLRVTFIVDLSHRRSKKPASVLEQEFAAEFKRNHWFGKRFPELWHDPRNFEVSESNLRGVLHAKTVIIDRKAGLITSANFTGAAQTRNIEAGILIRQSSTAARLAEYFRGLISTNALRRIQ